MCECFNALVAIERSYLSVLLQISKSSAIVVGLDASRAKGAGTFPSAGQNKGR